MIINTLVNQECPFTHKPTKRPVHTDKRPHLEDPFEDDEREENEGESEGKWNGENESEDEKENENKGKKKKKGNGSGEQKEQPKQSPGKFSMKTSPPEIKVETLIRAGIINIWLVGPGGCGKTTITRNIAKKLGLPCKIISCGLGTSAAEFNGYKYPTRESTPFAEYYKKPSIILLDEFTALDPSVAQVANSALANGILDTTTGVVERHPNCIIIATSNTFGAGADRQYVANNQLDSSTIDRFVGGVVEINYSYAFESQFDYEVVDYAALLRLTIEKHKIRRLASTRMIQEGHRLKGFGVVDWKEHLIVNWSSAEKKLLAEFVGELEEMDRAIKAQLEAKRAAQKKEELAKLELDSSYQTYINDNVVTSGSYVIIINRDPNKLKYPYIIKDRHHDFKLYFENKDKARVGLNKIKERIKYLSSLPVPVEVTDVPFEVIVSKSPYDSNIEIDELAKAIEEDKW